MHGGERSARTFSNELFLYTLVLVSDFHSVSLYVTTRTLQRHAQRPYKEESMLSNSTCTRCTSKGQNGVMKQYW